MRGVFSLVCLAFHTIRLRVKVELCGKVKGMLRKGSPIKLR